MKKQISYTTSLLLIPSMLLVGCLDEEGKTYYNRGDGGVTVVEQGENFWGAREVDVRRYNSQSDAFQGEHGLEIAIAAAAIYAVVEGGKAISEWWNERETNQVKKFGFVWVTEIERGSIAESIGIQRGDYVLEYAGVPMVHNNAAANPLKEAITRTSGHDQNQVEIVISRDGEIYKGNVPSGQLLGIQWQTRFVEVTQ